MALALGSLIRLARLGSLLPAAAPQLRLAALTRAGGMLHRAACAAAPAGVPAANAAAAPAAGPRLLAWARSFSALRPSATAATAAATATAAAAAAARAAASTAGAAAQPQAVRAALAAVLRSLGHGGGRPSSPGGAVLALHRRMTSGVSSQQRLQRPLLPLGGMAGRLGLPAARATGAATAAAAVVVVGAGAAAAAAVGVTAGCGSSGLKWAAAGLRSAVQVRTVWRDRDGYVHFASRGRAWPLSSRNALYFSLASLAAAAGYYWWCLETVPYTGRRHSIMFVSENMEKWLGQTVFQEMTTVAKAEGRLLPPGNPAVERVRRLGSVIAGVATDGQGGGFHHHMRGLQWEFAVIDDPMPNAMVLPGGKVIVYTGLLRLLGSDDNELAAVMAHEVGHVLARHQAERMSTLNVWTLFNAFLRLFFGFGLPDAAMFMGVFLPYSRLAETEADVIGLRLMSRACFDPVGAPRMLSKLNQAEKQMQKKGVVAPVPAFLRTHPLTEVRVKKVEDELPEAYRTYHASGCGHAHGAFGRGAAGQGAPGPELDVIIFD